MSWYTLNDKRCQFSKVNGKYYGKINGITYELAGNEFVRVKTTIKNSQKKSAIKFGQMRNLAD